MNAEDLKEAERLWHNLHAPLMELAEDPIKALVERAHTSEKLSLWAHRYMGELLADHRKLQHALIEARASAIRCDINAVMAMQSLSKEDSVKAAIKELKAEGFDIEGS